MRLLWSILALFVLYLPAHGDDFLDPQQAFVFSAQLADAKHIAVHYAIADGYHLYRDKFHFQLTGATLSPAEFPAGETVQDPTFGPQTVYRHDVTIILPFDHATSPTLQLESTAQGCAEAGICYAPIHQHIQLTLTDVPIQAASSLNAPALTPAEVAVNPPLSGDQFTLSLHQGHFWRTLALFFGAGILLSLTPCVFPMIPVLSSIIVQQGATTRTASFLLSLAYVLGMALTYALAGVAAAMSGTLISNTLQNPYALGLSAALFAGLALSMFGLYELQLPSALQSKFSEVSNRFHNGHLLGTFVMGVLSALIIGPCVAPPLAAALAWIAQSGNMLLGGAALFSLSIGMGAPLLLIGLGAHSLLPRAGAWMTGVKQFFGVALLAVAIEIIAPMLKSQLHMLLWAGLLIVSAVFWHALDTLPAQAHAYQRLSKAFAVIILATGLAMLLGALAGATNPLQPLEVFHSTSTTSGTVSQSPEFITVHSINELDNRLAQAKGKPVLLDFYADWCVSCKEMAATTFQAPTIRQQLSGFVLIQADITDNTPDEDALRKKFGIFGPPAMILFDADGQELPQHAIGIQSVDTFSHWLGLVKSGNSPHA
ncbi:MAG: protein-disulfide reductase DsbD [Betaproteobacteria bacterium]|nr:protein-disulfide reductase DsbD [Betaproteobacteria bacterium]